MPRATRASNNPRRRYDGGGAFIHKSDAIREYDLCEADLKAIDPLSVEVNQKCKRQVVTKYKLADVRRLSRAVKNGEGLNLPNNKGRKEIMRTNAIKQYQVSSKRLDAVLQPTQQMPNQYGGTTSFFWLVDVQALARRGNIRQAWATPAPTSSASTSEDPRLGSYYPITDEARLHTRRWLEDDEFEAWLDTRTKDEVGAMLFRRLNG